MISDEHLGELWADHEEPLRIGLRRHDLQQWDQLAGRREPILHKAVVAELEELLDPDPGVPQDLDGRPRPEGVPFFKRKVASFAGGEVVHPDAISSRVPDEGRPCKAEVLAGLGPTARLERHRCCLACLVDRPHERGERRQAFARSLVHA